MPRHQLRSQVPRDSWGTGSDDTGLKAAGDWREGILAGRLGRGPRSRGRRNRKKRWPGRAKADRMSKFAVARHGGDWNHLECKGGTCDLDPARGEEAMRRWIVALVAVAFLAGGPALATCKAGGKCPGANRSNCPSQQMSASGCGQTMKAGGCVQAMRAGGCAQGAAGCGSTMKAGCGRAMDGGCGKMAACGSMATCGSRGSRGGPISQDPSNIWFRGPAPHSSVAAWACDGHRCGKHGAMRCGGKAECRGMSSGCCQGASMSCGTKAGCQTSWKAGAGMPGDAGCQAAPGRKACKSGDNSSTGSPKGGCCAGHHKKA
jgi:hypothetical protein